MSTSPRKPVSARVPRQDGEATRQHLLDIAGQVFAERGFADATSKEICARANANLAAVNYYFGSRDQLYEAVLIEAHQHMVALDELQHVAALPLLPRDKLRMVLTGIVHKVAAPDAHWGLKVVIRELLAPTAFAPTLVNKAIAPKAMVMFGIVGEIVGLPPDSPALQRSILFIMGPCLALLIAPPTLRQTVFRSAGSDVQGLVDDMLSYVLAGLDAISTKYQGAQA